MLVVPLRPSKPPSVVNPYLVSLVRRIVPYTSKMGLGGITLIRQVRHSLQCVQPVSHPNTPLSPTSSFSCCRRLRLGLSSPGPRIWGRWFRAEQCSKRRPKSCWPVPHRPHRYQFHLIRIGSQSSVRPRCRIRFFWWHLEHLPTRYIVLQWKHGNSSSCQHESAVQLWLCPTPNWVVRLDSADARLEFRPRPESAGDYWGWRCIRNR